MCASSSCSVSSLCASREDVCELADANAYSQKCLWLQVFCVRLASSLVLRFSSACVMPIDVLASADADLRFQMEEAGVSADVQKAIYAEGFTSVRVFAGLEESREGVRAALKSSFKLDGNESPAMRKEIALLLSVWEGARSQLTYQVKNKEEAKQGTQNRLLQSSEYSAMRSRVEQVLNRTLKDREAPSKALVATKLEQLEDGVPKAEDLRDVTSYEDVEGEAYSAIIDPATAMLRIKPGRASTIPPGSPEELRLRHRRIGLAWDFVKTRHSTRAWVPDNCVDCFRVLSDHVLGSAVAGLRSASGQGPTWSLVLSYEQELRKAAYRYIRDGQCNDLRAALEKACDAPEVLTTHFVVPFTLGKVEDPVDMPDLAKMPWLRHGKGGKGKGGGKLLQIGGVSGGSLTRLPMAELCASSSTRSVVAPILPAVLRMCAGAASGSILSKSASSARLLLRRGPTLTDCALRPSPLLARCCLKGGLWRSVQLLLANASWWPRQMRPRLVMRTNFGTLSSPVVLAVAWSTRKEAKVFASLVCMGQGHRFTVSPAVRGSHSPMAAVCAPLDDGLPLRGRMLARM